MSCIYTCAVQELKTFSHVQQLTLNLPESSEENVVQTSELGSTPNATAWT